MCFALRNTSFAQDDRRRDDRGQDDRLTSGAGFTVGFVLLVPHFGLLLDGGGLGAGHTAGQKGGEIFAAVLASGACQDGPEIGLVGVFGQAVVTAPIEQA